MKILFTAHGTDWNAQMDERLGRAEYLVVYDEENDKLEAFANDTSSMEHGAGLQTAQKIAELGANVIITGNGAGGKVADLIKKTNIKTYIGAKNMTLKEAYEKYKNGELTLQ
jgi:predicted Fe-Mo cluster-binding NifX family protein